MLKLFENQVEISLYQIVTQARIKSC